MEDLSEYERARLQSIEDNKAKMCDLFGFLEPAKVLMKDLVPIKPLSVRPTRSHRASSDQPDDRLYSAREVEYELRKDPTRKYEAACVVVLRRSRRAPRVNYSLKRLWTEDDDEFGRPLKRVLGKQASRRTGPIDSGRGKRKVGKRIYDSKLGASCHQCRQKTTDRKAQRGGFYSVSHYLGDVIVNADGTWKVAPQAAKFRYREEGDVSEDEEAEEDPEKVHELADDESEKVDEPAHDESEKDDELADDESEKVDELADDESEKVDELADDESEKVDELADDESEKSEKVDELADDESKKVDDSGKDEEEKADDSGSDEEVKVDELAEDDEGKVDEPAEDEEENAAAVKNTKSPKAATKEDAKAENILRARKTDANAVTSVITEKLTIVEGKEDNAKVESKNKVSN
ncbi:hypothetical protein BG005_010538 [Podila minutissima]|nr:hypothetical protein BG005_010538 [Podila minutissima]